jgi:NDP-sugar pyrophosphorylase family protein
MPCLALLAGGLATRLKPITQTIPKAMIYVAEEPFIAHQLRLVRREGINRVVICGGYLAEQITAFVGDGSRFDIGVDYSLDGPRLLGTGGALKKALPKLGNVFLVMYGDSYLDTDFRPVIEKFHASDKRGLMTVCRNENRWDRSNVQFRDGTILRYDKKNPMPDMAYIDYGLGILRAEAFDEWPEDQPFDLADVYERLVQLEELAGYEVSERFYEIGSQEGLIDTDTYLSKLRREHVFH